ncbi:MAG: nucleotide exchange factor GrpE [Actinomycetota bacterium]|nr:nucleotide exchange factor GrpE [Actinomycetota bacterium]
MQNQVQEQVVQKSDYLEDLRRVQADFDNYRKRVLREQTQLASRASARLVERLLPVLDNFEAAISHGEAGNGVELVYKELRRVLEEEGLEEIPAEGQSFDPHLHEAFQAVEDEDVAEPTVRSVLRRGYTLKGQVLRASMVSVARPPDVAAQRDENDDQDGPDAVEG